MDRLKRNSFWQDWRWLAWLALGMFLLALLSAKAIYQHRVFPGPPLALFGQPAIVFFTLERSCPCQMLVVENAAAQLDTWEVPSRLNIHLIPVEFNRRSDLARKYGIVRAPALLLLDGTGKVVWRQDVGLADEQPLDLVEAEKQIDLLVGNEETGYTQKSIRASSCCPLAPADSYS